MENKRGVSVGDIVYVFTEGEYVLAKVIDLNPGPVEPLSIVVKILSDQGFRRHTFKAKENEYLTFEEKEKL